MPGLKIDVRFQSVYDNKFARKLFGGTIGNAATYYLIFMFICWAPPSWFYLHNIYLYINRVWYREKLYIANIWRAIPNGGGPIGWKCIKIARFPSFRKKLSKTLTYSSLSITPSSKISGSTFKIKPTTSRTCLCGAFSRVCRAFRFSLNFAYIFENEDDIK